VVERSREYDPSLRPSPLDQRSGNGIDDAAALCGVWRGSSVKKTVNHPNGEITEWNDVIIYFNHKQGSAGSIRGRGESVWRSRTISFLLEGSFDIESGSLQLRKIHVGEFNNILNYKTILGSPETFLVISSADDAGSLELKQFHQVNPDAAPRSSPQPLDTTGPPMFQLPSPRPSPYGSVRFPRSSPPPEASPPPALSTGAGTSTVYSMLPSSAVLPPRKQSAPVSCSSLGAYSFLLPRTAMEDEEQGLDRQERDTRIKNYTLYLSGMVSSDRLTAAQQNALCSYRLSQGVTDEEHQAALRSISMGPKEFERKLRTPSDEMCKVCYERQIDCIILPCGHFTLCEKCAMPLTECPVCRRGILEKKHVYRG